MKVEFVSQNNQVDTQNTSCLNDARTSSTSTSISHSQTDQNLQNTLSSRLLKLGHENLQKFQKAYKNLKNLDLIVHKSTLKSILDLFQSAIIDDQKLINQINIQQTSSQTLVKETIIAQKCFLTAKKLIEQNKLNRSLQFLLMAIEYNSSNLSYRMNLAILYIKLLNFSQAMLELQYILNCNPNCIQAYWRNGDCLVALKRYSEAEIFYQQGLKINPDNQACIAGRRKCSIRLLTNQSFYQNCNRQQISSNNFYSQNSSYINFSQITKAKTK